MNKLYNKSWSSLLFCGGIVVLFILLICCVLHGVVTDEVQPGSGTIYTEETEQTTARVPIVSSSSSVETEVPEDTIIPEETIPLEYDIPLLFVELVYIEPTTLEAAYESHGEIRTAIDKLLDALECPLYSKLAREAMENELTRLELINTQLLKDIDNFCLWEKKLAEYPYATLTWKYLKDLGYSDVACAGIIGNLMAECGGHTLALQPTIYDPSGQYYGICQWSNKYFPEIHGKSFEEQLDFLRDTLAPTFKTFGRLYSSGFTIENFNELESPEEAALAFAKVYERCAAWTYERRQDFAAVAYSYYVLDF